MEAMEKQSVNEKPTFNTFSTASSVTKTNNSIAFVVNQGGTLNFQGYHAHCYGLTLNGGSVTGTGSGKYNNEDFYLQADVIVGGSAPSTISIANGIGLPNRSFVVADATSSPAADLTLSGAGAFRGSGLLTKAGAGTMILSNANVHSGGTTVSEGSLLVNNTTGSGTGTGAVTVSAGATLGGTGIVSGALSVAVSTSTPTATISANAPPLRLRSTVKPVSSAELSSQVRSTDTSPLPTSERFVGASGQRRGVSLSSFDGSDSKLPSKERTW